MFLFLMMILIIVELISHLRIKLKLDILLHPVSYTHLVKGATVEATVEKQGKEKKVVIYKYNAKKHYHKKQGHRQPYTKLVINTINKTAKKAAEETAEA